MREPRLSIFSLNNIYSQPQMHLVHTIPQTVYASDVRYAGPTSVSGT